MNEVLTVMIRMIALKKKKIVTINVKFRPGKKTWWGEFSIIFFDI